MGVQQVLKFLPLLASIASAGSAHASFASMNGHRSSLARLPRTPVMMSPTAEELIGSRPLPLEFDWRNVAGQNFVTTDLNQHIPEYCGSCWIHGTVHALNDRLKVQRKAQFPDVLLSRQALLNCVPNPDDDGPPPGCNGGDPWMIHKYMHEHRVPDDTCMPYVARNQKCEPFNVCRNCAPQMNSNMDIVGAVCFALPNYTGYKVAEYGNLSGEAAMKKEIYARGPITCSVAAAVDHLQFVFNYTANAGVLRDNVYITDTKTTPDDIDHSIEVVGWGTSELGTKYWLVRNSWGTYWGDMGWFKIRRGVNQMMIEEQCDWAVMDVHEVQEELKGQVLGDYYRGVTVLAKGEAKPEALVIADAQEETGMNQVRVAVVLAVASLITGVALGSIVTNALGAHQPDPRHVALLG